MEDMSGFHSVPALIPSLIAQHGRWQAGKPALIDGSRIIDWREFDLATNRVANGLASLGLVSGDRLAVLMSNSLEMVLLLFGAGKAGVSVVPLNVAVTDETVAAMISDSGASAVAASDVHCERIDGLRASGRLPHSLHRLGVSAPSDGWRDFAAWMESQSTAKPAVTISPDTECNIIYSSGTTGIPKGIVHDHNCRLHWATDMAIALRYHSGCVTVCSLGLFSNISWVAMLATILVGGTIVVMTKFSPQALGETVRRYKCTHGTFVPVQLARVVEEAGFDRSDYDSLESIVCCGSPLAPALKRQARDALGCNLIELYGLTEGLITTLAPEEFERKLESVGRPVPGQQLLILDAEDKPLPPGESGEIVGFGPLIMCGYHNRPDANAEATWLHPSGTRWLRTGDIGYVDNVGFLYLVDRKKDLILSGGQNIYPADIEIVAVRHPGVAEVAVIGVHSEKWGETPLALVVRRPGMDVDAHALAEWINGNVGKQQRVAGVQFVDELPRNPNGKILKRELRRQFAGHPGQ